MIQPLQLWGPARSDGTFTAFYPDKPYMVDLISISNWFCWRHALQTYAFKGVSDVDKCFEFGDMTRVSSSLALEITQESPLVGMLEQLSGQGWHSGRLRHVPHLRTDVDKCLNLIDGFVSHTLYFYTLLHLRDVFAKGLVELHCCQTKAYYLAVLSCPNNAGVLPGMAATAYREMVNQSGVVVATGDSEDDDDAIVAYSPVRGARRHRVTRLPAPGDIEAASADDDDDAIMGLDGDTDAVIAVGPLSSVEPEFDRRFQQLVFAAQSVDIPAIVDNLPIALDVCYKPTHGPPYIRKRIRCPVHDNCFRNRNCNLELDLGQLGVIGYLCAWARLGTDTRYSTRQLHMSRGCLVSRDVVVACLHDLGLN
jgi:hypothetical protein